MHCPNCGRNTVTTQFNADIAEEFTWCQFCHWEPDYTIWREEEDDDETEY